MKKSIQKLLYFLGIVITALVFHFFILPPRCPNCKSKIYITPYVKTSCSNCNYKFITYESKD